MQKINTGRLKDGRVAYILSLIYQDDDGYDLNLLGMNINKLTRAGYEPATSELTCRRFTQHEL